MPTSLKDPSRNRKPGLVYHSYTLEISAISQ